jgi:hypothetical protein
MLFQEEDELKAERLYDGLGPSAGLIGSEHWYYKSVRQYFSMSPAFAKYMRLGKRPDIRFGPFSHVVEVQEFRDGTTITFDLVKQLELPEPWYRRLWERYKAWEKAHQADGYG